MDDNEEFRMFLAVAAVMNTDRGYMPEEQMTQKIEEEMSLNPYFDFLPDNVWHDAEYWQYVQ